jgi:hypothetical protein
MAANIISKFPTFWTHLIGSNFRMRDFTSSIKICDAQPGVLISVDKKYPLLMKIPWELLITITALFLVYPTNFFLVAKFLYTEFLWLICLLEFPR